MQIYGKYNDPCIHQNGGILVHFLHIGTTHTSVVGRHSEASTSGISSSTNISTVPLNKPLAVACGYIVVKN